MNILHMKYAVEVAKAGSINKASEVLYIAQPNLSRSIKELESDLGITIFDRSAKGMGLTPEGEEFIAYARKILAQIDEVEKYYKEGSSIKQKFSVSVPRASYIADAFVKFTNGMSGEPAEFFYKETNAQRTIKNILEGGYRLGIIRYAERFDKYFRSLLDEKGLEYELVTEFRYMLVCSSTSPLATKEQLTAEDISSYVEIAHADPFVPSISMAEVRKQENPAPTDRSICVFERSIQFELLSANNNTFMWVSPLPGETLEKFGLTQRFADCNPKIYRDVLIYKKDYTLTELDRKFITEVAMSKREIIDKNKYQ